MGSVGERLVELGWRAGANQYRVVCLAAEFADSDEWAAAGYSSAGRWIADKLDIARRTADEWIRVGRALRLLPAIRAALEAMEISYAKAKVLTRSATPSNEAELVTLAQQVPASELTKAIAWWSGQFEDDEVIDERQSEARGLRWATEPDGMVCIVHRVPPAAAGVLIAAVDARVMRRATSASAVAGDGGFPSLAQQRSDALIDVLANGGAGVEAEVVLHVRGDGATLDDGTPVTESAVARLLPDGFVRALIHDAAGRPIDASARRRFPSVRQRRVVKERDGRCVDCGSADLLEYDHVPSYAESRRTIVDELQLRCAPCHRARHQGAG